MTKYDTGKDFLGKTIDIVFDRPLGSKHPTHGNIYPVNYGFVPDTKAGDDKEIDVYYLSSETPLQKITGKCIGYVHRYDDNEDKLIATDGEVLAIDEIEQRLEFQEKWFKHKIILADKDTE